MVKETLNIIELSDIRAIRLRCENCKRELVQFLDTAKVPRQCPVCCHIWDHEQPNRGLEFGLIHIMQSLHKRKDSDVTVRFEINGEEDSTTASS